MTSQAKIKTLAEDNEDSEVTALLQAEPYSNGDPAQWLKDKYGDLDWAYTARVVRKWSQDALLTHIWEKAFSIPAREYSPSAPFVYVKLHDGEVITLPHGYRLPLMFVAKYYWGITLNKLQDTESWKKERANIFHLSRLCENLFQRARAKAFGGGMEKGWRCVMFDRLLARFYKGWYRNDPPSEKEFIAKFGAKEYDRDVLKHDWKRWCTRGLNGVKMKESEVANGITIEQFRGGLEKGGDGIWKLNGQPLAFITIDEDPAWSSTSELTDCDMYDEEGSDADAEGEVVPNEDGGITLVTSPPTEPIGSPDKRVRDLPIDEDELERATKRARIENISDGYHYRLHATFPLTRTLAAMAKNPVWATNSSGPASGSQFPYIDPLSVNTPASPSRPVQQSMASPSQSLNKNAPGTPRWSGHPFPISASVSAMGFTSEVSTPIKRDEPFASPKSVVVISRPKSKPTVPRRSSFSASSRVASSSNPSKAKARPSGKYSSATPLLRPTGTKPRQTRASQVAGVATVNVYVSDGKPRGGAVAHSASKAQSKGNPKSKARSPGPQSFRHPSLSLNAASTDPPPNDFPSLPLPDSATGSLANPVDTTPTTQSLPPVELLVPQAVTAMATSLTPSNSETFPTLSRDVITAKALELLVNLVDAKQILSSDLRASSSSSETQPTTASSRVILPANADHMGLAGRFQNLEERFSSVKEELRDIVGRLQILENEARVQREIKKVDNEKLVADKVVECSPVSMTQGIQTDRSDAEDVEMGGIARSDRGWDDQVDDTVIQPPQRVLGEIAVQTEEEDFPQSGQPDSQPEVISKSDQTPTQDILTAVEIRATDRNCGSETDTDSTVNAVKDEPIDPRAQEMTSNLSLLVNDLVSVKMLSVMGDMLKGKGKDPAMVDFEASLRSVSPVIHQSSDSFALTNLLDEVKTFKEESRAREMREKEEMQAMRQLHSAEVDALRRRLSYLESQNNHMDSRSIRSSSTHSTHADGACHISGSGHTDNGRHSRQLRRPYPSGSTPLSPSGSGGGEGDQASSLDSIGSTHALPTPVHSERSFSFARPGIDRDDELPLPIKSQRKQHMSFPRTTFG